MKLRFPVEHERQREPDDDQDDQEAHCRIRDIESGESDFRDLQQYPGDECIGCAHAEYFAPLQILHGCSEVRADVAHHGPPVGALYGHDVSGNPAEAIIAAVALQALCSNRNFDTRFPGFVPIP